MRSRTAEFDRLAARVACLEKQHAELVRHVVSVNTEIDYCFAQHQKGDCFNIRGIDALEEDIGMSVHDKVDIPLTLWFYSHNLPKRVLMVPAMRRASNLDRITSRNSAAVFRDIVNGMGISMGVPLGAYSLRLIATHDEVAAGIRADINPRSAAGLIYYRAGEIHTSFDKFQPK